MNNRLFINEKTEKITTVLFDFGGVLLDLDKPVCVDNFSKLGIPGVQELLDHWCQKGLFLLYEEGKISTRDFLDELKSLTPKPISDEDLKTACFSFLVGLPLHKLQLIDRLKPHYNIFMLSNINELVYNYCCESFFDTEDRKKIEDYFERRYLSFEMKICKPDKKIYELLLNDCGIPPQEILFLDDGIRNIEVAQQLGFNTYHVEPHENFDKLFETPLLKR